MLRQEIEKVKELAEMARAITIVLGENPSFDAMAASLSLLLSLEKAGKSAQVLCPTPPTVALANLIGINKVRTKREGPGNGLVISLPYKQGSIEKISYDIVGDWINLTVVPGPEGLGFTTEEINYSQPSSASDLLVAIGISSEQEAQKVAYDPKAALVNIDNNSQNLGYGTALVDDSYSSLSEMVARLISELSLPIDIDIAQNLLSGIVEKTKNFQSPHTSIHAFEAASFLMQKGARRETDAPPRSVVSDFVGSLKEPKEEKEEEVKIKVGQNKAPSAPKDWFEPKIYKGSTQV